MLATDLFEFAYVPEWYRQLDELKSMALPEPWRFKKTAVETKNMDTPILERYIHTIFRKQAIEYNSEQDKLKAMQYFYVGEERACFHTGLYTPMYKAIYACFGRNRYMDSTFEWYFKGFCDELSAELKYIEPLPKLTENREQLIEDCRTMQNVLTDTTAIDEELKKLIAESELVSELTEWRLKRIP